MAKKKLKLKLKKGKMSRKLVKDKAIVNFLLEHMKPAKINFSKVKIPSFINFLENEEKSPIDSTIFQEQNAPDESLISGLSLLNTRLENEKN